MGGFHLFRRPRPDPNPLNPHGDDIPLHPLSIDELEDHGKFDFALPTEEEIQDKGKSDWLAKTLVLIQTTWFVMQCITRSVEHLPITELEIVTLAYATMSFVIYLFWWNKPLNVERPIRVFLKSQGGDAHSMVVSTLEVATTPADSKRSMRKWVLEWLWPWGWEHVLYRLANILKFIIGGQDNDIALHEEERVPTFWSGRPAGDTIRTADFITLAVGVIFGAIHCIAWSFSFPSHEEHIIWCISCIAMVAAPVFIPIWWVVALWLDGHVASTLFSIFLTPLPLASLLYIISRVLTVALAFTCLRSLPPQAYETVHWTTFIPHI